MQIANLFGLLLLSVSVKLRKLAEKLGTMDIGLGSMTEGITKSKIKVWSILEGPFSRDDFPEEELWEMGINEDWNFMVVAKVEQNGELGTMNLWYDTLDEAYNVCNYFKSHIEPLELE